MQLGALPTGRTAGRKQHYMGLQVRGGDAGITALSDATAFGALVNVEKLYLDNNHIEDAGMTELCGAISRGALYRLTFLDLNGNKFCNLGMTALANAITCVPLATLETLCMRRRVQTGRLVRVCSDLPVRAPCNTDLHSNQIGDAGLAAFSAALTVTALSNVKKLWLFNNRVGDPGLTALAEAITKGWLVSLQSLQLEGNTAASKQALQATMDALARRGART